MKRALYTVLAVVLMTGTAFGQVETGDREVQAAGSIVILEGSTTLMISGTYGYFYSENLEFGGGPMIIHTSTDYGDDTNLSLTLFCRYNFTAQEQLVPYVGGQLYQYDLSPEEPAGFFDYTFMQFGGGFKYFVNEYIAYDISANLGFSLGGGDVSFLILAGISAIL